MTLTTPNSAAESATGSPKGEPDRAAMAVTQAVFEQTQPLQAILFGSRARGTHRRDSDIDVAIITTEPLTEDRQTTIDLMVEQAAMALHPESPKADVSFLTVAEFLSERVKKNTLANSIAKEGTPAMSGATAGYHEGFEEEAVNWDDVDARVKSAREAVTDLEVLASSTRSSERMVGYAAQQSLEHAYKALIASHGVIYPTGGRDGHNLRILVSMVQEVMGRDFPVPGADWQSLTAYAGSGRYRDEHPPLGNRQELLQGLSGAVSAILDCVPQRDQP